jgi:hypothetical protein
MVIHFTNLLLIPDALVDQILPLLLYIKGSFLFHHFDCLTLQSVDFQVVETDFVSPLLDF